jgi:hypothetical protein
MKKKLTFGKIEKEMLSKEQMKEIAGGYGESHCYRLDRWNLWTMAHSVSWCYGSIFSCQVACGSTNHCQYQIENDVMCNYL